MKKFILLFVFLFLLKPSLFAQWHPELKEIYSFKGWEEDLNLGQGVLNAGDINGDGYNEFISFCSESNKIFFFRGGFPVDTIPDLTFFEMGETWPKHFNKAVVANIDGDSLPEMIVPFWSTNETYIYKLGVDADTLPDYILNEGIPSVATGDLNGDGFEDIIMSGYYFNDYTGKVLIYLGGNIFDDTLDYCITGDSINYGLGYNIATGDLNGDGYDDLIVWGINYNISSDFDYVRIYFGSANFDTQFDVQINDPCTDPTWLGFAGLSLVCFDINQDGYDDLMVGGIYVFNGSAQFDTIPEQHIIWPDEKNNYYIQGGAHKNLFNAGDINKDGYPDLAIGMPGMYSKGIVHVRLGGKYGLDESDYVWIEPQYGDMFGKSVANIGDINKDGVTDLIIGEPYYSLKHLGRIHFYAGDSNIVNTAIKNNINKNIQSFQLYQNYPNPFNNSSRIKFYLDKQSKAALSIYDINGKIIKNLIKDKLSSGTHYFKWNGNDNNGQNVSSGIYFYRLKINGSFSGACKMIYIK